MNESVMRAIGIAFAALLAGLLLKRMREELSLGIRIAAIVLIFLIIIGGIREVLTAVTEWIAIAAFGEYAESMIRAIGLAFLCKICGDICRDCGENGLAGCVESAGKIGILLLCVPMVQELLETATVLWQIGNE